MPQFTEDREFDDPDGSEAVFSMYLDRVIVEDKEMVENWKGAADVMLVFAGLFSAAVATLLAVSIQDIKPSTQDISAFYLANLTQPSIPSRLSKFDPTESFIPPTSAIWINGLWFLSLVISLTCALLATLIQQWARGYLRFAYPRYSSPQKQARIRAFYRRGVERLNIPAMIEALPYLLHISLFLFFAGLSVFLFGVHHTIFKVVTVWIGLCGIIYACLAFLPFIRKKVEEYAVKLDPDIDYRSLSWTFRSLNQDTDFEKFFEGISRLCDSETGKELKLQQNFIKPYEKKLSSALIALMNRTLSSSLVAESEKQRRMIICTKVVDLTSLLGPWWILRSVLLGDWYRFQGSIDFGLFVQKWKNITHKVTILYAQCVAALTISTVRDRDERWFRLAGNLLKVSKTLLHEYIKNGDSILLANAMFIVRRTVQTYSGSEERHRKDVLGASSGTLETVCKLDIRHSLPEFQHEFCGLWNQLVDAAQTDPHLHHVSVCTATLKNVRKLYLALHDSADTRFYTTTDDRDPILDSPESYPMCTIDEHRPPQIPDLEFDEPPPDAASAPPTPSMGPSMPTSTPTFSYPPGPSSTFTPFHPSQSAYPPFVNPHSHLAAPHPPDAPLPIPVQQSTQVHASNILHGGNVQSSSPPSPRSTSSVPSVHQGNASNSSSHLSGGHVQSS